MKKIEITQLKGTLLNRVEDKIKELTDIGYKVSSLWYSNSFDRDFRWRQTKQIIIRYKGLDIHELDYRDFPIYIK